ncbi:TIGR04282 family arsenosugar biosynthesis glycosyltransferase [Aureibaculum sp. 2210JD6-5]|uniref:TIGR04282 family arsenosugar biosynthesis glycosyltransferase n=1 Tax=Aureibaculum sp. 2210JD6-5 TaxID=3103957 RepID=UPI002AAC7A5C|nr:TIGR04282 family arsenosugar biosynthesis glycosyltransferase [Aureibaculum sp. 2210JD6-5]MDY7395117.1 TIGR04282 family arsenosugar biosynthesis glycosyltransferase [Aureibaculum sp. 2210JD6-5]
MTKKLIIIFVKNIRLGKVKTRLAKEIGNQTAFDVYNELVKITETATKNIAIDKRIYFSDTIVNTKWNNTSKKVQKGIDLGERMKNAFIDGFNEGYNHIVLIGSDLPDIDSTHILKGLDALKTNEVVFGPAVDGGYYLVGLSKLHETIFDDKPWSQSHLLTETCQELNNDKIAYSLLEPLNDIDTIDDLLASDFYKNNSKFQQKIQQLNDR